MSDHNIIHFQPRPKPEKAGKNGGGGYKPPPMFNIPPATKVLAGGLLFVHLVLFVLTMTFLPQAADYASFFAGFTPASWSGIGEFYWWTPASLVTFSFLHGGWMHLGFNILMLVAMGSGLEKSIGIKRYLMIYIGTTLFAAFAHLALYPASTMPVIGASGGISGIFGAMLVIMNSAQNAVDTDTKSRLLPVICIYIGITILMGLMGAPDGSSVAWIAHIGGFLAGVGFMMTLLKRQQK